MWQIIAQKDWFQSTDEWSSSITHFLEVDSPESDLRLRTVTTQTHDFLGGPKPRTVETTKNVGTADKPNLALLRSLTAAPSKYYGGSVKWKDHSGKVGDVKDFIAEWELLFGHFGKTPSEQERRKQIIEKINKMSSSELEQIRKILKIASIDQELKRISFSVLSLNNNLKKDFDGQKILDFCNKMKSKETVRFDITKLDQELVTKIAKKLISKGFVTYISSGVLAVNKK